ncbi:hypothetical protein [Kineosporia sp. A_224]|jgi:hypothetical protein|uniref:hypothetical protein n=1 Tax=Kineosporia sp. A_224 TaxID=1962180 RepID=UPI000B4AA8F9|nr:hypothetical protein [Kineosporia sp. A_224]
MTEWEPDTGSMAPRWLVAGARVGHRGFRFGMVAHVGAKGAPGVWIDVDFGQTKALAPGGDLPFLSCLSLPSSAERRQARRTVVAF